MTHAHFESEEVNAATAEPPLAGASREIGQFGIALVEGFDFLGPDYRSLYARSNGTVFQNPVWLDLMRRHFDDESVRVLTARHRGRLCLAMPVLKRRLGVLPFLDHPDHNVCDYNAPVYDTAMLSVEAAWRLVDSALGRTLLARVRRVRADALPDLTKHGGLRTSFMGFHAHEVPIAAPFADWRAACLPPGFSKNLTQYRARLGRKGRLAFTRVAEPERVDGALERLRAFRKERFSNDGLQSPATFSFYRSVVLAGMESGFARLYELRLDDRVLGVIFGLSDGKRFSFLLLGYDTSPEFKNYSVGMLTIESLIEDCIARGETIFDFTIGDEAYKAKFGARSCPMMCVWLGNRLAGFAADRAFQAAVRWRNCEDGRLLDRAKAALGIGRSGGAVTPARPT